VTAVAAPELPPDAAQAHVRRVVERSGTSFYWGMRLLRRDKREAMFAIYAFCREVDDIADGEAAPAVKLAELARWRAELDALYDGRPSFPTTRALAEPIRRFALPRAELELMIEGMEMDAHEMWARPPPLDQLRAYCRRVAGAVGLLSMRVFGPPDPEADRGAVALGEAFQLTNILRDIEEDAAIGRIYLPRQLLAEHGIASEEIGAILAHPGLAPSCEALADLALARFAEAEAAFAHIQRARLRPVLIMQGVYRRTLERLRQRGFERLDQPVRIGRPERVWLALRHGLL
jgi:presqualene diphosphate synthase